ncbi:MAG TPA: peptide-N4-asparagine amidase [Candidatus Sulfotelmatobacter sp.]|nr:peptide-N4-asparagine amidase [Candidatus Sulfotelmatobacter sp.]
MKKPRSGYFNCCALCVSVLVVFAGATQAQAPPATIGSQNTVTADPPVPRPHEKPCTVPLFAGYQFVNYNIQSFQFAPPASCPGPYEKIVFTADFGVTAGVQFDRTAIIDLGYVNIYFGTTAEPGQNLAPSWHVERDETDYAALFSSPQTGHVILGNTVNSTYTGIISGSAQLEFYPAQGKQDWSDPGRSADAVVPLMQPNSSGGFNEPAFLYTTTDQLATTLSLPQNIERAYLDVITQSQIGDEFWYSCVPNDATTELESCGNTAFREGEVSIDGTPAGVAPVYPWIYTGGLDPLLWAPIPGVQTLNFVPYRVDLTPFAGLLSNGQQHTVALSVFNANSYFSATGTLLLYLDHGSKQVTGDVTENTLSAAPNPSITENVQTDSSGNVTGTVNTTSSRAFKLAGFVNTSHGRVETEVEETVNFKNVQNFNITATTYTQDVSQQTNVQSMTTAGQGRSRFQRQETLNYPLTFNYTDTFAADGSATQLSNVSQEYKQDLVSPFYASFVDNKVNSTDLLELSSSFEIIGNTGAQSSQSYNWFDSRGENYSCKLTSADNALSAISKGCSGSKTW